MSDLLLLLAPKYLSFRNQFRQGESGALLKFAVIVLLAVLFWVGSFLLFSRILAYFQSVELFGLVLAEKLLSMVLITLFSVLLFSNVITSLSTFYMSQDLALVVSSPVSLNAVYFSRFIESATHSSWMVLLFGIPVFLAYGVVLHAPLFYYPWLIAVLIPFLIIPSSVGAMITTILVNVFPVRRMRDILFFMSLVMVVALYFLFRFIQPEKLVDPEAFEGMVEFMVAMRRPESPLLPTRWAAEALSPMLLGGRGEAAFYYLMLLSTAMASLVLGNGLSNLLYFNGFSRAQESFKRTVSRTIFMEWLIFLLSRPFRPSARAMISKEIKTFFRDTTQWSQLFLLGALVVVYLYNIKVLPLDKAPIATFYMENLVSFLNLGLAGFVLSAISVRFIFPAISLETPYLWLLKSSPISDRVVLWSKFWCGVVPLVLLAELLAVLTNYFLRVTPFMMALSIVTIFVMTLGIISLGIAVGAVYPRFNAENVAQISTGFGGIVYMIICMAYVSVVILLEAWPVYLIFMEGLGGAVITPRQWAWIGVSFAAVGIINAAVIYYPMRIAHRRFGEMDA